MISDGIGFGFGSLSDPVGSSPIVAVVLWLQNTLLGTIALTVAIVAIASVGFMMLGGRVNVRYGLTVVAGCFVLFGASSIVAGLQSALSSDGAGPELAAIPASPPVIIPPEPARRPDPYAGASLPQR